MIAKKYIWAILVAITAAIGLVLFLSREGKDEVEQAVQKATGAVPEVVTNPVEGKVPQINPVDKVNPFKYDNPLR